MLPSAAAWKKQGYKMSAKHTLLKIVLPLVILLAGFGVMRFLISSRPVPQKIDRPNPGALVEVIQAVKQDRRIEVFGTGTVQPEQEVSITMQVSGLVEKVAPGFVAGGFFRQGEFLFSVEPVDYELAVERSKAALIRAENEITVVESKAQVARREWQLLNKDKDRKPNPLVVYEPQLQDARANRDSAAAALKQAELELARTEVRAPFNCLVRAEEIGVGKYVRTGNSVATVASIDAAEIIVPLSLDELQWLAVPDQGSGAEGPEVTVQMETGNRVNKWQGHLVRSLGEIDPRSRMARLVVKVADPYRKLQSNSSNRINLQLGMFVDVIFHGAILADIFVLPRKALRDNSTVWIMDPEQKLRVRPVKIMRLEKEVALIKDGLKEGDLVVLTALPGGVDGMALRQVQEEKGR